MQKRSPPKAARTQPQPATPQADRRGSASTPNDDLHPEGIGTPIRKVKATLPPSSGSSGAKKG